MMVCASLGREDLCQELVAGGGANFLEPEVPHVGQCVSPYDASFSHGHLGVARFFMELADIVPGNRELELACLGDQLHNLELINFLVRGNPSLLEFYRG